MSAASENDASAVAVDRLKACIALEESAMRRVEVLIEGLAEALKATSNDQNVQRLAREIRASASALARITCPR